LVDFVNEVEEQLRAERNAGLAMRLAPWFVAALVATVVGWLGVWGFNAWRDRNVGAASVAYDKGLTALAGGDLTGAYNDFAPIAKSGPAGYRTLALMQQADIRLAAGKVDEAASLFDAAAKAAPDRIMHDLAGLRAAQAVMDTAPYPQVESRLKPLIGDKRPFTLQAREMLALVKLEAGQAQAARGDFNALVLALGVAPDMRARAQAAIALIDSGQAGLVAQVVKAAATLPPSSGPMAPAASGASAPAGPADGQEQGAPPAENAAQPSSGNAR
jgi:hypothetical protein